MTLGEITRHAIGIPMITGGLAWLAYDVVSHKGQIAPTTAIGCVTLCLIGGWLTDFQRTTAAVKFLGEQGRTLWKAAKGEA